MINDRLCFCTACLLRQTMHLPVTKKVEGCDPTSPVDFPQYLSFDICDLCTAQDRAGNTIYNIYSGEQIFSQSPHLAGFIISL